MKEKKPEFDRHGEPEVRYATGYELIKFPYYLFDVHIKVADHWNKAKDPDVYIKVFRDDRDVTPEYFDMEAGVIRPTLYNLREVLNILDENLEAEWDEAVIVDSEDDDDEEEEDAVDTVGK